MGVGVGSGVNVGVGGIGVKKEPGAIVAVGLCKADTNDKGVGEGTGVRTAPHAVNKKRKNTANALATKHIYRIMSACS
jgi:hypothetical protein